MKTSAKNNDRRLDRYATLHPARRHPRADAFVTSDARAAADTDIQQGAALRAEFGVVGRGLPGFGLLLTNRTTLHAGKGGDPFRWNRLAAQLAQHGCLPIAVIFGGVCLRGPQPRPVAGRTRHALRCVDQQRRQIIILRVWLAAQQPDASQTGNGVVAPAGRPPMARGAD